MIGFTYSYLGANWFVGAFGLLVVMNLMIQGAYYFSLPRALARRFSDPTLRTATIETLTDGVKVERNRSIAFLPFTDWKHVWVYRDFVLLAPRRPMVRFAFVLIPTDGMTAEVRHDLETAAQNKAIT